MADVQVTNGNGTKLKFNTVWKIGVLIFLCGGFYYKVESIETKQNEHLTEAKVKIAELELVQRKQDVMLEKLTNIEAMIKELKQEIRK